MLQPPMLDPINLFEQQTRGGVGKVAGGLSYGGQWGPDELRQRGVVETGHGQVFGEAEALGMSDGQHACGHIVIRSKYRGRAAGVAEQ